MTNPIPAGALVAAIHYVCFGAAAMALAVELTQLRSVERHPASLGFLAKVDGLYGLAVLGSIGTGLVRLLYLEKGPDFYLHNGFFHAKLAVFIFIGLLSIYPTYFFLRHRKQEGDPEFWQANNQQALTIQRIIVTELLLLLLIPVFATLMARGYGAF